MLICFIINTEPRERQNAHSVLSILSTCTLPKIQSNDSLSAIFALICFQNLQDFSATSSLFTDAVAQDNIVKNRCPDMLPCKCCSHFIISFGVGFILPICFSVCLLVSLFACLLPRLLASWFVCLFVSLISWQVFQVLRLSATIQSTNVYDFAAYITIMFLDGWTRLLVIYFNWFS